MDVGGSTALEFPVEDVIMHTVYALTGSVSQLISPISIQIAAMYALSMVGVITVSSGEISSVHLMQ